MGSKKGHRRSKESEETGTGEEHEHGELMVLNGGSVDLNGQEDKKREKKRKVDSGDVLDDGARKGNEDKHDHRKTEEVERKKEAKEKNRWKKRKIEFDEQQHERGDADIGSKGSDIDPRKVEEERKGKKEKKDQKKKVQNVEDPRSEKGHTDFIRVELDDGKVVEDIKKEKRKKKRIVENHQHERGNADFSCYGVQQSDEMLLAEVVKEDKGKENKKKQKKSNTKGERQSKEKQNEEQTDGPRKRGLEKNVHVLRSGACTTVVKCDNKGGDKGKEKVDGGNFDFPKDIEGVIEPAEILENTRHKKGRCGREKNGGSDMESEEHGDGQSKCNGKEWSESELSVHMALTEVGGKGKLVKKGEKKKKKADATTRCLEGNSPERKNDNILITKTIKGTPGKAASKKVTFAENVEVFPSRDGKQALVVGKRYSKEEDELLKQAVHNYIEFHGLGENGIEMVLCCQKHKRKGCWKEICKSIPWRSSSSIYQRVHTLFERVGGKSDWSPEDQELIMQHYKKHGSTWKQLSNVLGKYRYDIKDMFRNINHGELRRGKWTPEELDTLYELVNKDLRMSANAGKKKHQGMFRDNIAWTAISEQLATRQFTACCRKWYRITSPMVSIGIWNDSDDYELIDTLVKLDACSFMEVDWDNLLEHRAGEVCVRRWKELIRSVDRHYSKTFMELVEILSKRYSWDVLEARGSHGQHH